MNAFTVVVRITRVPDIPYKDRLKYFVNYVNEVTATHLQIV